MKAFTHHTSFLSIVSSLVSLKAGVSTQGFFPIFNIKQFLSNVFLTCWWRDLVMPYESFQLYYIQRSSPLPWIVILHRKQISMIEVFCFLFHIHCMQRMVSDLSASKQNEETILLKSSLVMLFFPFCSLYFHRDSYSV